MNPTWFKQWGVVLVFALAFCVLGVDAFTRHGVGDFIWYYVPLLLSFSAGGRFFPLWTASALSVLMAVGFFSSPPGMEFYLALVNRCMGLGMLWVLALLIFYRRRTEEELWRVNRALKTISDCNQVLARATEEAELLNEVCRVIVEKGGYRLTWVGFAEHDEAKTVRPVARAGFGAGYMEKLSVTWTDTERGHEPTGTAIRTGRVAVCHDMATDPKFVPWREQALQFGLASSIVLPLESQDGVFGALSIYAATRNAFDPQEEKLLSDLANNLAFGIQALRARARQRQAEDEIRRLNAELEQRVADQTRELNRRVSELQTIFEVVPVGLAIAEDVEGRRIRGNPAIECLTGVARGGELSLTASEAPAYRACAVGGSKLPLSELPMQRACRGEVVSGWIMEFVRPDGQVSVVHCNAMPLRDENGRLNGAVGAFTDITESKQAEEQIVKLNAELQQRAAQLEVANKELESFSYSVSHDLRTPLRAIDGFSRILLEEHAGQLNAEGREHLERVCAATRHMGQLIDDLLMLSRVTRSQLRCGPVDLSNTATKIAAELKQSDPARHAAFNIQPGVTAHGDPNLLRILLDNLLGNAWKFTGKQSRAKIEFGRTVAAVGDCRNKETNGADGGHCPPLPTCVFFVRDNGVGFDMAYAKNLFGAFQRLHSVAEFPGTGIGLATVQRIIHRHGGRVWAESQPGHGAVFYFTLPSTLNEAKP